MKKALRILSMILIPSATLLTALPSRALPADHYAGSSVLSSGKWARVKVTQTGMHLITDAELRKLGFNDPSKVRVYGTGGNELSYAFTSSTPDDLPLQPSARTKKGIVFFATDHISWEPTSGGSSATPYAHSIHPYSHDNYYFLSDRPLEAEPAQASVTSGGGKARTDFDERIVHEKELEFAGESGSQIYGEDFRSKRSQTFNFTLTDAADDKASVYVRFAAKNTNGSSLLGFKANGKALPASNRDRISSCAISEYCTVTETSKEIDGLNGSLALTIDYSQTGTLFMARLDYIEAFYLRKIKLDKGELHFYGTFSPEETISVSGCSPSTVIWDVTDPAAPKTVKYTLRGDKAEFGTERKEYREFVAFEPENISRNAVSAGSVSNQDIHGLPTPDMVIITFPEYRTGAERIAALHEEADGFRVHVLDAQPIYNEFSGGKPDVGAFRKLLKMWYDRGTDSEGHNIRYCLLMGKPLYDNKMVTAAAKNAGFTPMPIYQSYEGLGEHYSYSTDDFIAKLEDVEEGRFSLERAKLNVAVGRLPVTNATESLQAAEKIEKYVKSPSMGAWRNKVMIIADDDDRGDHLYQAQSIHSKMRSKGDGASRLYDRVYLDSYKRVMTGVGPTYPQATERMMRNYNDGVFFTNYIGHASAVGWGHEHLWEWESITSMTNRNLTFIMAATCGFAYWDDLSVSGAEHLLLNPDAGAIGLIAASRTVYVDRNGRLNDSLSNEMFKRDSNGMPRRFGDVYKEGKNGYPQSNTLRYAFLGDPAIRIPGGSDNVVINTINGIDVTGKQAYKPELTPQSTAIVEGVLETPDGNIDTGFNGSITLQLYDAERVITTYGQGDKGVVVSYNDRDKRLASANAEVKAGRWKCTLRVPPEIQGNYSPALISAYAWSDANKEANGHTEHFYIYGYIQDEETDTVGPVIEKYYVNSPNFTSGDLVNSNPMIFARLRDESGINISDSGIGHAMTLTIDGTQTVSGLNSYYSQDIDDPDAGTLAFPLEGITPGRHELTLTVWDNANNVSKASVEVNVGAATDPVIYDITASTNPTHVDFRISIDRPNTSMQCDIGVFDLSGRRIWSLEKKLNSDMESVISSRWDLCDSSGTRVQRGIYIYRVRVESPEGTYSTKSKKIAISSLSAQ